MGFYYNYDLTKHITPGIKIQVSSDFRDLNAVEGELSIRFYLLKKGIAPFIQAGGGGIFLLYMKPESGSENWRYASVAATAGFRIAMKNSTIYLEPYARYAYPASWAAGLFFGGPI
jgi:hypothetical protein